MSENSNSANSNNWTLLTPEVKESGVENVGHVAEGLKIEGQISKAPEPSPEAHSDLEKHSSEASAHQPETETSKQLQSDPALTHESEPPELSQQVTSPETSEGRAQLNAAHVSEEPSSVSATVEDISSWTPDHEKLGLSESPVTPSADIDSFSDSYTHISPTSGSSPLPASVCQERDWFQSDEDSLRKTITEESKEVLETNRKEGYGLRKRKISHLGSLDKTEAEDDEEGEEEDFQPPQREEETVFSLNKCILAAVILLGLGTIFFSEADMDVRELKDPTNQEWLNPEISKDTPVGLQPPDMLSKQAKEDQHILVLQEQLQQHQGELKAAQLRAEEGEKERVRREELEKEYERLKGELDRVPALQKELEQENERMKEESARAKKELEALPSLQRELEHLRAKVSQLTQSTGRAESVPPIAASRMPSAGVKSDVPPMERQDMKPRKTWDKKSEEKEQSKGDKEWKKKKSGKKEDDKERRERVTEGKHTKEQKDWKKDKSHQEAGKTGKRKEERKEWKKDKKQDYDQMGKESEDKKDFKEWEEKKEWKEDKKWKKDKHVGQDERTGDKKDWKDTGNTKVKEENECKQRGERKEDKDWKSDKRSGGNDHREWKGEKEWRKEKSEGKHSDKTEKKWKGDKEFPKEYDEKEIEEKQWRGKQRESQDREWPREGVKEEKKKKTYYHKNEGKNSPNEKEKHGHGAPDETFSHHHYDHENYWTRQRARIQHYDGQRETCSGVADCARVEGLSPVSLRDFETLLQSYLKKLQDQDQTSRKGELSKLVKEFFTDGVFAHDQMPFREFVEDVGDILEDMAEGEESDSEGEESEEDDDDDEMEEFEREAMEKFALPEEVRKGEQKKESRRVKG
ncbi:pre-B-cell leukemia transcription factor-interacting protein 1-like isoform X5 [Sinocyclocheilus rhinocerous]|uniref:pre-B-cell leukemia transcription factor-interacting protein 1-like isoform X5 n=1 Tax=Sinocyclocheilus rhinocerous TaxID=307959 RepID=UPI0007B8F67A|nr:PREDICTED: pre-B-cell leukemia transcription factor-interacting protein 1-like isoform X5 [Sinocyclocheilus rhinocerous]